jgi:hypothetical protein
MKPRKAFLTLQLDFMYLYFDNQKVSCTEKVVHGNNQKGVVPKMLMFGNE